MQLSNWGYLNQWKIVDHFALRLEKCVITMYEIQEKGNKLKWTESCQKVFNYIKKNTDYVTSIMHADC